MEWQQRAASLQSDPMESETMAPAICNAYSMTNEADKEDEFKSRKEEDDDTLEARGGQRREADPALLSQTAAAVTGQINRKPRL